MKKKNVILLMASLLITSFSVFAEAEVQEKSPSKESIQSNILTIYKDATLIQQIRSISTETGKGGSFQGIPNSICPESFMISSATKEPGFEISGFSLASAAAGAPDLGVTLSFKNTTSNLLKEIQLLYLFKNLDWHIDYALYFSPNYEDVKLNAWIEVNNKTGVAFPKAQIQFIDCLVPASFAPLYPSGDSSQTDTQFSHKNDVLTPFDSAHAYVYDQLVDIPANGAKRISWVNSQAIKAKQDYRVFVGGTYLKDMEGKPAHPLIETWISFQNTKEQTLGCPLPKGETTLYHGDEKGAIEVLGKAFIPHTPVGQEVSVKIPATQAEKSFSATNDNKALRTFETELEQTEFKKLSDKITESSYRLNLKNKANLPITIRVTLDLPQGEWTVVRENISHQQNGEHQVFWTIQIGANSEVDLKYRVRLIRD
ncbi:MAG: hypothetical protein K2W94_07900 [Alphaproteobacteria bacterium]|nr:hypothetical protein [Alphaproteobacteria bacterium]